MVSCQWSVALIQSDWGTMLKNRAVKMMLKIFLPRTTDDGPRTIDL